MNRIEAYISALEKIANDNSHGYDNRINHNLGNPDFDCGAFVSYGLREAGLIPNDTVYEPNQPGGPWGYHDILTQAGFRRYPYSEGNLQRGDILIKDGHHTEVYLGSGIQIGAHDNYDGVQGDWYYGTEISKCPLSQGYWDYIYRLEGGPEPVPVPTGTVFTYQVWDDINREWLPNVVNDFDYAGIFGSDVDNIYIDCSEGDVEYCVHTWAGDGAEVYPQGGVWLPWVRNREDFAGDNIPIDAIAIKSDRPCEYQVHLRKSNIWLERVSSQDADLEDGEYGYAGMIGEPIDAIIIRPF